MNMNQPKKKNTLYQKVYKYEYHIFHRQGMEIVKTCHWRKIKILMTHICISKVKPCNAWPSMLSAEFRWFQGSAIWITHTNKEIKCWLTLDADNKHLFNLCYNRYHKWLDENTCFSEAFQFQSVIDSWITNYDLYMVLHISILILKKLLQHELS